MKCIKHYVTMEVVRVTNKDAERYTAPTPTVPGGMWRYCSKQEWKEQRIRDHTLSSLNELSKAFTALRHWGR